MPNTALSHLRQTLTDLHRAGVAQTTAIGALTTELSRANPDPEAIHKAAAAIATETREIKTLAQDIFVAANDMRRQA
jgi:hypothetical protein